ncbi:nuclear transport factor 2 family protein [Dactylosporangium sp. NPDC051485]|uniref:nuclear transport factor 2 family protein n=1 Tax=Dactylosporangium sp. NPDC051485 TaxID=3154846 RepID=UPI003439CBE5
MSSPRALVERFLQVTVSAVPGDLADFYADEVVIEMPFAVPGLVPPRIETTREQLRARFAAGRAVRRYTGLSGVHIHETAEPGTVIAEYDVHGAMVATGAPFTLRFVMVMTIRDGRIVHTRDYSDPIAGARALGRLPELVATLSG